MIAIRHASAWVCALFACGFAGSLAGGLLASCSDVSTHLVHAPLVGDASHGENSGGTSANPGGDSGATRERAMCGRNICQCDDGEDNDDDGLVDGLDPECTAPFDNDEESFATGGPKAGPNSCEDCFWDGNADPADDGCTYSAACRTTGGGAGLPLPPVAMPGPEIACRTCEVTPRCIDSCRGHAPNGCDCFGCCEITREDGAIAQVVLQDECSVKHVDDPRKCPPCVQNAECVNPCGPCELCLGKKMEDLPPECMGESQDLPQHQCDEGYDACSESAPCAEGYYCVLGCCLVALL